MKIAAHWQTNDMTCMWHHSLGTLVHTLWQAQKSSIIYRPWWNNQIVPKRQTNNILVDATYAKWK